MRQFGGISRRASFALVAAGLTALSACTQATNLETAICETKKADPLTVMTFNIRVGHGVADWGKNPYELRNEREQLGPIIAAIRSVDPDIVGLQEVLTDGQVRRIARALDLNYSIAAHPNRSPWWGVAVLSKCPIEDAETFQISSGSGNAKNMIVATIKLLDGQIVAASIHKDKDLRDGSSFRAIRRAVEGRTSPVVLIGDFNVTPRDRRFDILGPEFVDTAIRAETSSAKEALLKGTWGSGRGHRIDYVLVRGSEFDVLDAGIISEAYRRASDHFGYYAKIRRKTIDLASVSKPHVRLRRE